MPGLYHRSIGEASRSCARVPPQPPDPRHRPALKPAAFSYHAPCTLDAALALLAEHASAGGRVLAGGQSLVPAMALRLARPAHLIDINRIDALAGLRVDDGHLAIGACVRHARFERPVVAGPLGALLACLARYIAHAPIRTRGTFCGSLANADPASEWCLAAVALSANLDLVSTRGGRTLAADDFFQGTMTTAREDDELLIAARLPIPPADLRWGFVETSRRAGDFALAMALVTLRIAHGRVVDPCIALGGVEDRPRRIAEAEAALAGKPLDDGVARAVADVAAGTVDPVSDARCPADYRRDLVRTLVCRALLQAAAQEGAR